VFPEKSDLWFAADAGILKSARHRRNRKSGVVDWLGSATTHAHAREIRSNELTAITGVALSAGLFDPPGCLIAVEDWHLDIYQDEVGAHGLRLGNVSLAVRYLGNLVALSR
jgi:hypothetical protein